MNLQYLQFSDILTIFDLHAKFLSSKKSKYSQIQVEEYHLPQFHQLIVDMFKQCSRMITFSSLGDVIHEPPAHRALLRSLAGVDYQHFAKSKYFGKDLYHEFVAPGLQTDILTETWQHGAEHNIGPSCDGDFTVEDISDISIVVPDQHFSFWNNNDHSKFVVAKSSSKPFVCVGDINRQVRLLTTKPLFFLCKRCLL